MDGSRRAEKWPVDEGGRMERSMTINLGAGVS